MGDGLLVTGVGRRRKWRKDGGYSTPPRPIPPFLASIYLSPLITVNARGGSL
jgi:hypothetical protein